MEPEKWSSKTTESRVERATSGSVERQGVVAGGLVGRTPPPFHSARCRLVVGQASCLSRTARRWTLENDDSLS